MQQRRLQWKFEITRHHNLGDRDTGVAQHLYSDTNITDMPRAVGDMIDWNRVDRLYLLVPFAVVLRFGAVIARCAVLSRDLFQQ
jgi:hypothetical protein